MSSILVTSGCLHSRRDLPRGLTTTKSALSKAWSGLPGTPVFEHLTNADSELGFACENHKHQLNLSFWTIAISWKFRILSLPKMQQVWTLSISITITKSRSKKCSTFRKLTSLHYVAIWPFLWLLEFQTLSDGTPSSSQDADAARLHGLQIIVSGNNHKRNTISCCFISPIIRKVIFTPKPSVRLWSPSRADHVDRLLAAASVDPSNSFVIFLLRWCIQINFSVRSALLRRDLAETPLGWVHQLGRAGKTSRWKS